MGFEPECGIVPPEQNKHILHDLEVSGLTLYQPELSPAPPHPTIHFSKMGGQPAKVRPTPVINNYFWVFAYHFHGRPSGVIAYSFQKCQQARLRRQITYSHDIRIGTGRAGHYYWQVSFLGFFPPHRISHSRQAVADTIIHFSKTGVGRILTCSQS
jgi:hypothetical protein